MDELVLSSSARANFEAVIPAGVRAGAGTRNQTLLKPSEQALDDHLVQTLPVKQRQTLQQLILADEPLSVDQLKHWHNAPMPSLRS